MTTPRSTQLSRRRMLGVPVVVVAAVALAPRPAQAKPRSVECVADLMEAS
ncbi:hypothetical protein AB0873_18300 [Micromonospora sp. NPDC047707]